MSLNYEYDKKRLETFIDAIIAIILTILVLELRVPEGHHAGGIDTKHQLYTLLHPFISYIGSYLLIIGIWIDHNILFLNLKKINKRYILINFFFLLSLSFVPFTTAFAGVNNEDSFAVALLFVNYFLMNMIFSILYWYAGVKGLLPMEFFTDNKRTAVYSYLGIVAILIAIPLAYVNTYISFAMGIIIFGGHLLKKK
jgi:uncharacterized membrane protein